MRVAALALLIATAALLELTPSTAVAAPNEPFVRDVIVAVSGSVPKESRRTPARIRSVNASIRAQARSLGVKPLETYATATRFFTARVTPAQYTRLDRDPSLNLLYGAGIHVCPGAPLARLELRVLMEELLSSTELERAAHRRPIEAIYPASGFASCPLKLRKR